MNLKTHIQIKIRENKNFLFYDKITRWTEIATGPKQTQVDFKSKVKQAFRLSLSAV